MAEPVTTEDLAELRAMDGRFRNGDWTVEHVGDPRAWREKWREAFQPTEAGCFRVLPPWHAEATRRNDRRDRLSLIIEPEMAFGTGQHPTTQLCLELLSRYSEEMANATVADIGAGSAILGIAAALLGARQPILATEIDPDAAPNAWENWRRNGLEPVGLDYRVQSTLPEEWRASCDWVICNMLSERFLPLLQGLSALLRPDSHGRLTLSGYLEAERGGVHEAAEAQGLTLEETALRGDWIGTVWCKGSRHA